MPDSWNGGPVCTLTGSPARRLASVLRMTPGDTLPALGPDGTAYTCTIVAIDKQSVSLSVIRDVATYTTAGYKPDIRASRPKGSGASATLPLAPPAPAAMPKFILAVALLKGSKLDEVVRAATEAGVSAIIPLVTSRSIPREHAAGRIERLRRVVSEALGQSGSSIPTRVLDPLSIAGLCAGFAPVGGVRQGLFFHEAPLAQASIHRYCTDVPNELVACIGPEGGFEDDEIRELADGGFLPAWLGPTVLRAETAAIFAVASLRIVCLERSSWSMTEYREQASSESP